MGQWKKTRNRFLKPGSGKKPGRRWKKTNFAEAKKPAIKMRIDFGAEIGVKRSSAQITDHYGPASLIGKQVIAVTNLADKKIGPFISECLVTGFIKSDQSVILAGPDKPIANGTRLA